MNTSITDHDLQSIVGALGLANRSGCDAFPGDQGARQPVHTVYGGAHLFKRDTTVKIGKIAQRFCATYASTPAMLMRALPITNETLASKVLDRLRGKLESEAVEDFRIDFEDGFGPRPAGEEDETAVHAAQELAAGIKAGIMSPFSGIRIKSFAEETKARGLRTLDLFLTTLLQENDGEVPAGFVVTLPKITNVEHVTAMCRALEFIEKKQGLTLGSFKIEFMIETPQSVFTAEGQVALPAMVEAAKERCIAAHFGTYDYTASLDIIANEQRMDHPACDMARHVMKVALAGRGIWLSDGATNIMPVPPHHEPGSQEEKTANEEAVYRAWRLSYDHIRHSLTHAYYQGWDLHPAQLPVRYAALYAFFLEGLEPMSARLEHFIQQAAKATLVGEVFDDAATGQGLLNYFIRALACGAITEDEVKATGLTVAEVQSRSFLKIVEGRQSK